MQLIDLMVGVNIRIDALNKFPNAYKIVYKNLDIWQPSEGHKIQHTFIKI